MCVCKNQLSKKRPYNLLLLAVCSSYSLLATHKTAKVAIEFCIIYTSIIELFRAAELFEFFALFIEFSNVIIKNMYSQIPDAVFVAEISSPPSLAIILTLHKNFLFLYFCFARRVFTQKTGWQSAHTNTKTVSAVSFLGWQLNRTIKNVVDFFQRDHLHARTKLAMKKRCKMLINLYT